ncbi:DUF962 domain-containing protein [Adhaeribacter aquaticus]|uniref:Mpo1 family 2-hydroxy fatty acid dioxygenase n=1 Tax=Adhaeribacter aquaticus TaxID=299567 RepID=UPI0003F52BD2|nr:Mpo1-like protein [Adhaeribacter aquaticus]
MEKALRPVDVYFAQYSQRHQHPVNQRIHWVCVPLFVFSILGLVWSISFPQFSWLGGAQRYLNFATFLIAFAILYYWRLSFRLAVAMWLSIIIFSTIIISLEKLERLAGWPPLWKISLSIFILSGIGQFIGHMIEGKMPSILDELKFLLIGPIYLWQSLFKKLGITY